MYIACKELKLSTGRKAQSGDQLPEVLAWAYPAIVAHLNLGWIKWVDDTMVAQAQNTKEPEAPVPPTPIEPAPTPKPTRKKKPRAKPAKTQAVS